MKVIATYNLKGGVGKTATAVNLAYLASRHGLRTLLWDLDAQGAASFHLRGGPGLAGGASELIEDKHGLPRAIRATPYAGLELIPADFSYRNLDLELTDYRKSTLRLRRLLREVSDRYALVLLDCAPSMSVVSENVLNMADVLLVPLIPTHLSVRAFEQLMGFRREFPGDTPQIVPFFSMVDRRKRVHREVIIEFAASHPDVLRSYVPYAAEIERMGEERAPVNVFADASNGGRAFHALWLALGERLGLGTAGA
jgi:chromosome partitioning protein